MILDLLAPVPVDVHLVPGAAVRDPERYESFWRRAAESGLAPPVAPVEFHHVESEPPFNRYRSIETDSLPRPLSLFDVGLQPEDVDTDGLGDDLVALLGRAVSIRWSVHDHGIALLDASFDLGDGIHDVDVDEIGPRLAGLQSTAVALGAALAERLHRSVLVPLVAHLRSVPGAEEVLQPPDTTGRVTGQPMWVARSLTLDRWAARTDAIVRYWTKDVDTGSEVTDPVRALLDGSIDHLTKWLNYVSLVRADPHGDIGPDTTRSDRWTALRHAQYFYAALDDVDTELTKILAAAFAAESIAELGSMEQTLRHRSRQAQLIVMELHDASKLLKRSVNTEMQAVLRHWSFDELAAVSVRTKTDACEQRIASLQAKRSARAALYTDLILLTIGVTSILGTSLLLADFGRKLFTDPALAGYDIGRGDLLSWIAAQPSDAIILVSGAISALLVLVYLFLRRSQHD